jgi:Spy/CpxP family protein refolding chaperone
LKKTRFEILLIGLTVLALSAGVVAGLLAARIPAQPTSENPPPPMPPGPMERSLAEELDLSKDQREKMRNIWENVRADLHVTFARAQDLQKDRDNEIAAMLDDGQKAKFEQIARKYKDQETDLSKKRKAAFDLAVRQTKELLNKEQAAKYDEILKVHVGPGGPPPDAMPPTSPAAPTTKPAT